METNAASDKHTHWKAAFIVLSTILAVPIALFCLFSGSLPSVNGLLQYFVWLAVIPPFASLVWLLIGVSLLSLEIEKWLADSTLPLPIRETRAAQKEAVR